MPHLHEKRHEALLILPDATQVLHLDRNPYYGRGLRGPQRLRTPAPHLRISHVLRLEFESAQGPGRKPEIAASVKRAVELAARLEFRASVSPRVRRARAGEQRWKSVPRQQRTSFQGSRLPHRIFFSASAHQWHFRVRLARASNI